VLLLYLLIVCMVLFIFRRSFQWCGRGREGGVSEGHAENAVLWLALMQVQVVVQGQTHLFDVSAWTSGADLKRLCAKRASIPAAMFGLYYQSRPVANDRALASYGVHAGSTIELKARLRGGTAGGVGAAADRVSFVQSVLSVPVFNQVPPGKIASLQSTATPSQSSINCHSGLLDCQMAAGLVSAFERAGTVRAQLDSSGSPGADSSRKELLRAEDPRCQQHCLASKESRVEKHKGSAPLSPSPRPLIERTEELRLALELSHTRCRLREAGM